MPIVQDKYVERGPAALEGMPGSPMNQDLVDALVVETTGGLGFGLAVFRGTADHSCDHGSASSEISDWVGVTMRTVTQYPRPTDADGDKYIKGIAANVAFGGDIYVKADGAVADGDEVTVTSTTGRMGTKATASGIIELPNAVWLDTARDGELARVRLPGHLRP